jgi:isoquinoline 1-oxidoreductase subunit beta
MRRRAFLIGSAAIAGGVAVGIGGWWATRPPANPLRPGPGEVTFNPYVLVTREGVSFVTPRAEMGQGVQTTLAALVAEEMDLDWTQVRAIHGPASVAYANAKVIAEGLPFPSWEQSFAKEAATQAMQIGARLMRMQLTGGSTSIIDGFDKMRLAGAGARAVLVEAAAQRLGLPAARLRTEAGAVVGPDGRRIPYPELAEAAALIAPPSDPPLKPRSEWRLLGRSLPRLDMEPKVGGTATFGIDVRRPGMVYAAVRANPHLGGGLLSFDASAAERVPDVLRVLRIGDAVAAVARNTWAAMQAVDAVEVDWGPAPYPADTQGIFARIAAAFDQAPQMALRSDGDVEAALGGPGVLGAEYRAPYLAHATMEPMSATALFRDGRLTIWTGTQAPTNLRDQAADLAGIGAEAVAVNATFLGGGFGRRFETDAGLQAVRLALAMPETPVKLTWSREEDIRHDFYRPAAIARMAGRPGPVVPQAVSLAVAGASLSATQLVRQAGIAPPGPDRFLVEGAFDQPYAIPHFRVVGHVSDVQVPVGFWRSVGYSFNTFFLESFLDELAHAAGLDPVETRLRLLRDTHPPSVAVVEAAAQMAGWGDPLPPGRARGVAFCLSYGSPTAQVVQIARTDRGIAVEKVWCAQDVGMALDPGNIEAQIQSGIIFGLSAAMAGEITFAGGAVEQSNFHDYDAMRMNRCPTIETRILQSGHLGGVGEPGTPPIAPALGNAIFALTGQRIRELPFRRSIDFAA